MLFRKQRNEFFELLTKRGFIASDFKENYDSSSKYEIFFYKDQRFRYSLQDSMSSGVFKSSYAPLINNDIINNITDVWRPWEYAVKVFNAWLDIIKYELETPDLWAEAQANAKMFAHNLAIPDEMFNATELRQLEGQVRQLVQGLSSLALPPHAEQVLTTTVKEIPEKATRFSKKELEGWFMGAFIAQVTNLALSQEHVSAIAYLIKTTFFGLLGLN